MLNCARSRNAALIQASQFAEAIYFLSDIFKEKYIFTLKKKKDFSQLTPFNETDIVRVSMKIVLFRFEKKKSLTSDRN